MWNNAYHFGPHSFFPLNGFPMPPFYIPYPLPDSNLNAPSPTIKTEQSEPLSPSNDFQVQSNKQKEPVKSVADNLRNRTPKSHNSKKKVSIQNLPNKKQKKDRNLPSNICRLLISFMSQHPSLSQYLGLKTEEQKLKLSKCLKEVKTYVNQSQAYIRPALIEQMCQGVVLSQQSSQMFRLIFRQYMKFEFRMTVCLTKRFKKKEKLSHFRVSRNYLRSFMKKP